MKKRHKIFVVFLFVIYIVALVYVLFLAESFGRTWSESEYSYNFIPFETIRLFWRSRHILPFKDVFLNLAGNVIAFMPFGLFFPMLMKGKKKNFFFVLLCGFLLTCSVEVIQLITRTGCCDVDDVILNTAGVIIGYIIYAVIKVRRHT